MTDALERATRTLITFGRHKGRTLGQIDASYLAWLAGERRKDGGVQGFKVPADLKEAAKLVLADVRSAADVQDWLRKALKGQPDNQGETLYVVERLGDLERDHPHATLSGHQSLDEALAQIGAEFSAHEDGARGPDPEDDRVLVWEILPSGHKKVVWHFSGWHWDAEEFGLPQGTLPGDADDLYTLANL